MEGGYVPLLHQGNWDQVCHETHLDLISSPGGGYKKARRKAAGEETGWERSSVGAPLERQGGERNPCKSDSGPDGFLTKLVWRMLEVNLVIRLFY